MITRVREFFDDNSGQFAIMASVCSTALVLGVGVAIDYSGALKTKSRLQSQTDIAVLAAARLKTDKIGQVTKAAKSAVSQNNSNGERIKLTTTINNGVIRVEARTSYSTYLMGAFGKKRMEVFAVSEAPIPKDAPVNIALVLDSTGSMAGANMDALKSASKTLLEIFEDTDPGAVKAGVVPYAQYVNVGMSNRNAKWMDVPNDSETTSEEVCYMTRDIQSPELCKTTTSTNTCYNDSGSYSCESTSQTCPEAAYGPEYETCYIPTVTQTWNGCVGTREAPNHLTPKYKRKQFPGIMNVECGSEILDLTEDLDSVLSRIDSLSASGNTYIPTGLSWGWKLLDPSLPFGGLSNKEARRKRALILMTDGENTVRLNAPNHDNDMEQASADETNKLTLDLCDGIKADKIEIFSVSYKLGSGAQKTQKTIEKCSSGKGYHFSADNQAELETAFEQIALSLYEVRLSR